MEFVRSGIILSVITAVYIQNIPPEDRKGIIDCNKYNADLGITLEFCAGIVDKNLSLEEIAKAEIMEETGYDVSIEKLEKIRVYRSGVGAVANETNLFYTEVDDSMKTEKGGGLETEGEFIDIVELSLGEAEKLCNDVSAPNSYCCFNYGLLWFFHYKAPKIL